MKTVRHKASTSHELTEKPAFALVPRDAIRGADGQGAAGLSEERIRMAAYALYEARGRAHGHDLDDWLNAKAQLDAASAVTRPADH